MATKTDNETQLRAFEEEKKQLEEEFKERLNLINEKQKLLEKKLQSSPESQNASKNLGDLLENNLLQGLKTFIAISLTSDQACPEYELVELAKEKSTIKLAVATTKPTFFRDDEKSGEKSNTTRLKSDKKGYEASASIGLNYAKAGVSFEKSKSESNEQTESGKKNKESVRIYKYVPVYSFVLPRMELKLTEMARFEAKQISDAKSAREFLRKFGSHFPTGTYELGGIYSYTSEASFKQDLEKSRVKQSSVSKVKSELGVDIPVILVKPNLELSRSQDHGEQVSKYRRTNKDISGIRLEGTHTHEDPDTFTASLARFEACRIIKRPTDQVAVWQFFQNDQEL
jgi:hypothetical protein